MAEANLKDETVEEEKAPSKEEENDEKVRLRLVSDENDNLEKILDIPLRLSVELGRSRIMVQDLLEMHKGSVMELDKLAGEPLEILVNDKVVAKGEVVVVNEKFGVRLTDIVSHTERIRKLGEKT